MHIYPNIVKFKLFFIKIANLHLTKYNCQPNLLKQFEVLLRNRKYLWLNCEESRSLISI